MLQEDRGAAAGAAGDTAVASTAGDAVQREQVAVLRPHHVTLGRVAVQGYQLRLLQTKDKGRLSTTRVRAGKKSTAGKKRTPISLVFEPGVSM